MESAWLGTLLCSSKTEYRKQRSFCLFIVDFELKEVFEEYGVSVFRKNKRYETILFSSMHLAK